MVEVDSPHGTLVALGETRSRGWRATLDGAPVPIYAVNEAFQTVVVPPGHHRVHWQFISPGFSIGLALAGVGLLVLAVAVSVSGAKARHGKA
jgi:uncharacterized membrane protein YfhO